ncbi:MAG: hypothetical protein ABSE62_03095 [Chthoniobacteraceae bacterium]|jgi:hypothetical protein
MPTAAAGQDPEFIDARGLLARFGIKRSMAYKLLAVALIHGASIRLPGHRRGKRLFEVASVRRYLTSQIQRAHEN